MKNFFKTVLAVITGMVIMSVVCCLILAAIIGALSSLSDKKVEVKPKSVLHITLESEIKDRAPSNPFEGFDPFSMEANRPSGLKEIIDNINKAKEDDNIKGILLEVTSVQAGISTVNEIRNALLDFKTSGKFIYSYNELYSQGAYYLSTAADSIFINPEGYMDFRGLQSQIPFVKGLLSKLEVEPQLIRHGKYKSAGEMFVLDKMSDENRAQALAYVSAIWNHMVKGVSETRHVSAEELNSMADSVRIRNAKDAVDYKLMDGAVYYDQVIDLLKKKSGVGEKDKLNLMALAKYTKAEDKKESGKKPTLDKIAIVYAQGDIVDGNGGDDDVGGAKFAKAIREARENEKVKAVVLRVNSPGGSAIASEIMLREVALTKKVKPVIVSMGDVAASGGYYISCLADTIIANPTTITGSIGVFGLIPNAQGFFNNKLGITFDGVETNAYANFGSTVRPLDDFEKKVIQSEIDRIYETFISHVADGRGLAKEKVDDLGQGRVWAGTDAKNNGLVDVYGGLSDAIALAAEKAGLKDYRILELPKKKEPFQQILEELTGEGEEAYLRMKLGEYYECFRQLERLKNYTGIQARLPYEIELK